MSTNIVIITGPMGSGNHLFSKIFDLHPDVKGWEGINDGKYRAHKDEPHNVIWQDASAIDTFDWEDEYYVISCSCPYILGGEHVVPKYKEAIQKFLDKGFNVHVGIIGRDTNILELQQKRLRGISTSHHFLEQVPYLTTLPHTFLSMELAQLYQIDYIKSIGKALDLPVVSHSVKYKEIFGVNSNRPYIQQIEEGAFDAEVRKRQLKGRQDRGENDIDRAIKNYQDENKNTSDGTLGSGEDFVS